MIGVKKIAHATYEMPDVDKQVEYYTEIMGLTVTGKEQDAVFLASTVDHHSVVLRKGGDKARCVRLGFQIAPDDDLDAFERQVQGHGIKTERKKEFRSRRFRRRSPSPIRRARSWRCSSAMRSPASAIPPRK